jgi:predicted dehydrogenase
MKSSQHHMKEQTLRWGFLSTAHIGRKNWKAIRNSGNGTLVAVASRSIERSREFIRECQKDVPFDSAPRALGSYEELLSATDIDAVYIPLPTGLRADWVIRAAEAGKHIVCEKPCATSAAELKRMLEACERNNVQFLDGVMFMHSARLDAMREAMEDSGGVGRIRRISTAFSFRAPDEFFRENIRADSALEPFGCLGDLGWYCIRFALWAMKWQMPHRVAGRLLAETRSQGGPGVPTEFSGELFFEDGVSSGFYCSFLTHNEQWAYISGTQGYLHLADFVAPFFGSELEFTMANTVHNVSGCDFNMEPRRRRCTVQEYSNSHATAQETNLFRHFAAQVRSGKRNPSWPDIALKTQRVMETCLESAAKGGALVELPPV